MDPRQPTQSSEETIRDASGSVQQRTTETPSQRVVESTTVSRTPGGDVTKHMATAGANPTAAREYGRKKGMFHIYQVLWYILGFIEVVLALRFFLKITGANPNSGFAEFIYSLSTPFAGPFLDLFSATPNRGAETTSYFEWSTIVAGLVYVLVVWGIVKLIQMGKPVQPGEVERTVSEQ